jgi:hypothetical protein
MMETSRHKSVDTLRGYVRDAELFRDHAGDTPALACLSTSLSNASAEDGTRRRDFEHHSTSSPINETKRCFAHQLEQPLWEGAPRLFGGCLCQLCPHFLPPALQ